MSLGSELRSALPPDLQNLVYESFHVKELAAVFVESDVSQPNHKLWNRVLSSHFPIIYETLMTSDNPANLVDSWFELTNNTLPFNRLVSKEHRADLFDTLIMTGWVDLNILEKLFGYNFMLPSSNFGVMLLLKIHDVDAYMFVNHFSDLMNRGLYDAIMFMLDRLGDEATQIKSAYTTFSELVTVLQTPTNWNIRGGSGASLEDVVLRLVYLYADQHPLDLIIENKRERSVLDYIIMERTDLAGALIKKLPPGYIDYSGYMRPDGTTYFLLASQYGYPDLYDIILEQAPELQFRADARGKLPKRPQLPTTRGAGRARDPAYDSD